ncbi:MAG TPA: FecR domain-containing protein [Thermoanaerobaculia bacterium]
MDNNTMQPEDERIAALLKMAGPRAAVPADVMLRVRSATHDAWSDAVHRSGRRRIEMWIAAAAAAALVIALQIPKDRISRPRTVAADVLPGGQGVVTGSVISTLPESTMTLKWREHGSLRLAASTLVRFDSVDAITLQRGTIYFSSDAGAKPIVVRTKFGIVRDIGTQFEARLEPASLRIRVREGRIELNGNDAEAGTELTAGADGVKKRSIPVAGADWNWVLAAAPPMTLEGNAREVLAAIAREKGLKLIFTDRALADSVNRMSLHSRTPLTPDEALVAATTASNLAYRVSGDTLTIERRRSH